MNKITRIGLDIAKNIFVLHAVNEHGKNRETPKKVQRQYSVELKASAVKMVIEEYNKTSSCSPD